jgi:hypothetical protein
MNVSAIWRRLDRPGHDAACLVPTAAGWSLRGTAVFRHPAGPACLHYHVAVDAGWRTRSGGVHGFLAGEAIRHRFSRDARGWHFDGGLVAGMQHLCDLDFGFTPATNLLQIRRAAIAPGQSVELPVAWFDIGATTLAELPQRYQRRDERSYWYEAPGVPYQGLLEVSATGFAETYPGLWQMER